MTSPPRTIIGTISTWPVIRSNWQRRLLIVALVALFAILTLFPQKYRAAVSLTPTDPTSLGLSGTLGQLGAVGNVFGNQAAIEVSLKVGRSEYVRSIVAKRLDLEHRLELSPVETHRWLDREVDVRSLRGGIIQFETKQRDPEFARAIVAAYGVAVREQLATIARTQTELKRNILASLVGSASDRLARAQSAYDMFRLRNRYSSPQTAFFTQGDRVPQIEEQIRAKQAELGAIRAFATDQNIRVRQVLAEIASLRTQLAQARSPSPTDQNSVGNVIQQTTQLDRLYRELLTAQSLYDSYKRYLQGTSVEDLTSSANIRILEPAYIDTERQINVLPLAIGLVIVLIGLAMEFYRIRPPLEAGRD